MCARVCVTQNDQGETKFDHQTKFDEMLELRCIMFDQMLQLRCILCILGDKHSRCSTSTACSMSSLHTAYNTRYASSSIRHEIRPLCHAIRPLAHGLLVLHMNCKCGRYDVYGT